MTSGSFFIKRPLFIQSREDALRHLNLLVKGLKQIAVASLIGGACCSVMAVLLGHLLTNPGATSNADLGAREMSKFTLVAWLIAIALLVFSALYLVAGWGLSGRKAWARYTAAATFATRVLLCAWLGRTTISAMAVFLLVASWDLYGLWVLLSKETGQLFGSTNTNQAASPNRTQQEPAGLPEVQ